MLTACDWLILAAENICTTRYCPIEASQRLTLKVKNFQLFQTRADLPSKQVTVRSSQETPDLCSTVSLQNNGGEDDFGNNR